MAIFHLTTKVGGRSSGKSVVAAAAYRSREVMTDERTGKRYDYRYRGKEDSEILAPDNSPEWATDRARLWNEVEKAERRSDARTYREIEAALPKELSWEQQRELVREFVRENYTDNRIIADVAYHRNNDGNPHAHILLTTRSVGPDGFGLKNRDMNKREALESWRESWEAHANKALERAGRSERIDRRTLQEQGLDRDATRHLGPQATALERAGIRTTIGEYNAKVVEIAESRQRLAELKREKAAAEERVREMVSRRPGASRLVRMERQAEWKALRAEASANFWVDRVSRFEAMRQEGISLSPRDVANEKAARAAFQKSEKRLIEAKATHDELARLVRARGLDAPLRSGQPAPAKEYLALRTERVSLESREQKLSSQLSAHGNDHRNGEMHQTAEARSRASYFQAEREMRELSRGTNAALRKTPKWVPGVGQAAEASREQLKAAIAKRDLALKRLREMAAEHNTTVRELPAVLRREQEASKQRLDSLQEEHTRVAAAAREARRAEAAADFAGQQRLKGPDRLILNERHRQRLESGLWDPGASRDLRALEAAQGRALAQQDWNTLKEMRAGLFSRDLQALRGYESAMRLGEYRDAARAGGPRDATRDTELEKNALGALKELDPSKHDRILDRAHRQLGRDAGGSEVKRGTALAGNLAAAALGEARRVEREVISDHIRERGRPSREEMRDLSRMPTDGDRERD